MPIHEYLCLDCGHIMEEVVRSQEDVPHSCNHCDCTKIEKLPSAPGGYYINGNNGASVRPKGAGSFKRGK